METEILPPRQAVSASRLTRAEWILLMVLGAIQFTHILDCVLLMPLGPALEIALKINARDFGIMVSVYSFSASLSGLLAAWFIDRFDRKSTCWSSMPALPGRLCFAPRLRLSVF